MAPSPQRAGTPLTYHLPSAPAEKGHELPCHTCAYSACVHLMHIFGTGARQPLQVVPGSSELLVLRFCRASLRTRRKRAATQHRPVARTYRRQPATTAAPYPAQTWPHAGRPMLPLRQRRWGRQHCMFAAAVKAGCRKLSRCTLRFRHCNRLHNSPSSWKPDDRDGSFEPWYFLGLGRQPVRWKLLHGTVVRCWVHTLALSIDEPPSQLEAVP